MGSVAKFFVTEGVGNQSSAYWGNVRAKLNVIEFEWNLRGAVQKAYEKMREREV